MTKILFFAGSARKDSDNKKLAKEAAHLAQELGAEATFVDLKDFEMPLYDGDWEAANGLPEKAKEFKILMAEQDGFFIASPEYNSSFSPLLKNILDWISRPHMENEPQKYAFAGKVAALAAASPGGLGGIRGLVPLRMMLGNISVLVTPSQMALSFSSKAFDENGHLIEERNTNMLKMVVQELIDTTQKIKS